jgi:hypothetical protein
MSLLTQASLVLTPNAYKANKLYSIIPSSGNGDMITTRATTATRVNSSGLVENVATGIPRLDYSDGTASLLLEPQRTNVRTYSEAILTTNNYIANNSILSTVSITTPSASSSANLLILNVGANTGNNGNGFNFSNAISLTNLTQYTQSLFVKPFGTTTFRIRDNVIGGTHDFILIGNGTAPSISGSLQAASITPYINGWYRVSWTFTTTSTAPGNRGDFWALKTNIADGVNGVYIWGSQMETGSYATSYIPTTTSTVTRNLDLASVNSVSSLIGQTEGVLFVESAALFNDLTARAITISDGTTNNRIIIVYSLLSNQIQCFGTSNGVQFTNSIFYNLTDETQFSKIAVRYRVNDISLWVNGAKRGTDITSQALPLSFNKIAFDNSVGAAPYFSKVKSAQLYKTYLTDAEMTSLTTL